MLRTLCRQAARQLATGARQFASEAGGQPAKSGGVSAALERVQRGVVASGARLPSCCPAPRWQRCRHAICSAAWAGLAPAPLAATRRRSPLESEPAGAARACPAGPAQQQQRRPRRPPHQLARRGGGSRPPLACTPPPLSSRPPSTAHLLPRPAVLGAALPGPGGRRRGPVLCQGAGVRRRRCLRWRFRAGGGDRRATRQPAGRHQPCLCSRTLLSLPFSRLLNPPTRLQHARRHPGRARPRQRE